MSAKHPIIAVTGSSGAGTTTVKNAFEHLFRREGISVAVVEGDAFHRYDRAGMKVAMAASLENGINLSHFGPDANIFDKLEERIRRLLPRPAAARLANTCTIRKKPRPTTNEPGTFTPWEDLPSNTDLLFYEGLHGGVVNEDVNIAQWVDLLIGVVPIVNLEWIQKIHRDTAQRGYSAEAVTDTILRRMPDYVQTITPQFSRSDINFQRVAVVDTSNPFIARDIPTPDESLTVIRFRNPDSVDFPYYLQMLQDSWMSRPNTLVVPGGKMGARDGDHPSPYCP